jgi:hypothetical protein
VGENDRFSDQAIPKRQRIDVCTLTAPFIMSFAQIHNLLVAKQFMVINHNHSPRQIVDKKITIIAIDHSSFSY